MNAQILAVAAYATPTNAHKSPRAVEYDLFAQITAEMRKAQDSTLTKFADLAAALHRNRALWSELAFDLASDDNALPVSLKAQLLSLSQFAITHTNAVLAGEEDAQVLIDINLAIMRGLKG